MVAKTKSHAMALASGAVVSLLALSSCQAGDVSGRGQLENSDGVASSASMAWDLTAAAKEPQAKAELAEIKKQIRQIARKYDGEAAAAVALPGATSGKRVVSVGELSAPMAWSTSKVPVAIAALRQNPALEPTIEPMIQESDNTAAEIAWLSLGSEQAAAKHVNRVLLDGGDTRTEFEPWVPPGNVEWELADQAVFGANLSCIEGADVVLDNMAHIVSYQSYGLSTIGGAKYKGGWGDDADGGYLMRQFGVVPAKGGQLGVAIAVRPGDSADETGRKMLDEIAVVLKRHLPKGGTCKSH